MPADIVTRFLRGEVLIADSYQNATVYVHIYRYICLYIYIYICIYIDTCNICMYMYICTCTYVYVCGYIAGACRHRHAPPPRGGLDRRQLQERHGLKPVLREPIPHTRRPIRVGPSPINQCLSPVKNIRGSYKAVKARF